MDVLVEIDGYVGYSLVFPESYSNFLTSCVVFYDKKRIQKGGKWN